MRQSALELTTLSYNAGVMTTRLLSVLGVLVASASASWPDGRHMHEERRAEEVRSTGKLLKNLYFSSGAQTPCTPARASEPQLAPLARV